MVSGIIALLNQAFPNHTPEMIVDRLLASANNSWFTPTGNTTFTTHGNSIKHGYHSIWGHGIPDAYAALSPITTSLNPLIGISTGGSMVNNADNFENLFPPSITELTANPSFGDSLVLGLKNENGYFYDALGGGFKFDLSTLVKSNSNKSDIKEFINNDIMNLRNHRNVAIFNNNYINVLGSIDRNKNFVTSVSIDTPSIPIQYFHNLIPSSFSADSVYTNPFVNQKNGGLGLSTQYKHGNSTFMLGIHDSGNHSGLFGQASDDTKNIATSFIHNSRSVDHLAVISGVMEEKDTLLGSKHSGAIGISGSNPKSYFNGFNIEHSFKDNLFFKANTILARTIVKNPNNSLIHSFSPISSSSFEISLIKKNIFDTDDRLLISLSQPNRIETGSMNFKIQDLADSYGNIKHNLKKINLEPSGRQIDFGINYIKKLNDNAIFGFKNVLSKDYSHYKDSNLNHLITATASINF